MTRASRYDPARRPGAPYAGPWVPDERGTLDRQRAATARSILACPAEIDLLVDGVATVLDGDAHAAFGVHDLRGSPAFVCDPASDLAEAASAGRSALLTLASGLGGPTSPERRDALVLAGRLEVVGQERCECCAQPHTVVGVRLNFVLLTRGGDAEHVETQERVPLPHFASPEHGLNPGFLQRTVEHAVAHHQDELRRAVSVGSQTPMAEVVGVHLTDLTPHGVVVAWADPEGAHRVALDFTRPARTPAELADLLRRELHAGLG